MVLFDMDGTLIDTVPLITHCFQEVYKKFADKELTDEDVRALFGPGESVIFSRDFGGNAQDALTYYLHCYTEGQPSLKVAPEVLTLLDDLQALQIKMAIVTNKERDTTTITLEHFHLTDYFPVVVTSQDVSQPKPSPEGVLKILSESGENPSDAVMIGDTENDCNAAMASHVPFIWALWYVPQALWPRRNSGVFASSLSQLRDILPYGL